MKQGRASSSGPGSRKVEPTAKAVDVCGVSQIGQSLGNIAGGKRITSSPLYEGKGYEAPMSGSQVHKRGSQGRH